MWRFRYVAAGLAIVLPLHSYGAFERLTLGGAGAALAGATVALDTQGDGTLDNPACFAGVRGFIFTTTACPALFGMPDLRVIRSSLGVGVPWGGVGISASMLGVPGYTETTASLSAAYEDLSGWRAGIRINLLMLSIDGYGSAAVAAFDAGVQVRCAESVSLGVMLANVGGACIGEGREALPQALECGVSFAPPESGVLLCASAVHQLLAPLEWRLGLSYAPCECLVLRTGISTEPALLCGGFGVVLSPVSIDYGVSRHWQLGLTHHVSVALTLG